MCDSGQFIFRKEHKCSLCGKSPAAQTDEYSEDGNYCRDCALETFGKDILEEAFDD